MPQALITTPESVHLLLAQKNYPDTFRNLDFVIVDEWHELIGTKRGVQVELALSRLKAINPQLRVWGISATIGNLDEAKDVLLGTTDGKHKMIRTTLEKKIDIETIIPEEIEKYPWGGHLGIKMMDQVLPIIHGSGSTPVIYQLLDRNARYGTSGCWSATHRWRALWRCITDRWGRRCANGWRMHYTMAY